MEQSKQPRLPKATKTSKTTKVSKKTETKSKITVPKTKTSKTTKVSLAPSTTVEQSQNSSSSYMVIGGLSNKIYTKVQKAFNHYQIDVHNIKPVEKTLENLESLVGNENYIIIDNTLDNEKYEITDKSFSKVFKNKSCGTWKQIIASENTFVYTF